MDVGAKLIHDMARVLLLDWENISIQSGLNGNGDYVRGLVIGDFFEEHDGASIIVKATAPYSYWVEVGHGAYNLAEKIDPSKWRVGKNGNRFIRIPFSHSTSGKGGMPSDVYKVAKKLSAKSPRMTEDMMRKSGIENFGIRSKLHPGFGNGRSTWGSSPYENMFKNTQTTINRGSGKATSSSKYKTIRTITPDSSWIIPPVSGKFLRDRAVTEATPKLEQMSRGALVQAVQLFVNSEVRAQFNH